MNEKLIFSQIANFQPKQLTAWYQLLDKKCKYLLYGGSMSGGKSYLLRWAALGLSMYFFKKYGVYDIPIGLFSEDYPTLKDRQISRIDREFPKYFGELKEDKIFGMAYHVAKDYGGGRILLRNLDDPSKYMSSEFAAILVEELTRNEEQTFRDLRNRLRYPGVDEVKFMGATNPGGIGHGWVKKYFIDKITTDPEQERFFYIHANAYDNKYIEPTYIKQLESLPEQQRKAYLEGSWDIFAGQYFPEFSTEKHVIDSFIPKKDNFYFFTGGMDWGRENPFSLHVTGIQQKKHEGVVFYRAFTFLELYGTQKSPFEWGNEIKRMLEFYDMTLDDINTQHGIQCDNQIFGPGLDTGKAMNLQFADSDDRYRTLLKPAVKDRKGGWENMHHWLSLAPDGIPYWVITKNCKNLIRTLPQAIHDEIDVEDIDDKGETHSLDACRYQFSDIKWIDATVGGIGATETKPKYISTPMVNDKGQVITLDLDKFGDEQNGKPKYF
jgi:phage terminase large subunit